MREKRHSLRKTDCKTNFDEAPISYTNSYSNEQARRTFYNGRHFRSRLEAKWAFVFDECGFPGYQYEPRTFTTSLGPYLPDMFFYHEKLWLEIKPLLPSEKEIRKLNDVQSQVEGQCYFLCGFPSSSHDGHCHHLQGCAIAQADGTSCPIDELFSQFDIIRQSNFLQHLSRVKYRFNGPRQASEVAMELFDGEHYDSHKKLNQRLINLGIA